MSIWRECKVTHCQPTAFAGCWLIAVEGALDGGDTLEAFEAQVESVIDRGARWIVLDVARITSFVDLGHGSVVKLSSLARKAGGGLILLGLSARERIVFDLLKISHFFHFAGTDEEAMAIAKD